MNGEEKAEEAGFGFINLDSNRYNVKRCYDMRHFDADEFAPAKILYEYAEAYKTAESDKKLYVAKEGYSYTVGLSEEEQAKKGISRKEMLDKSFEAWILPSSFDTYWTTVGDVEEHEADEEKSKDGGEEIGSYDDGRHSVTVKPSKSGGYIVEDNGEETEYDGDDGVYEAAMYLYDRLAEDGKTIKVEDDEARAYIIECAAGMKVKIVKNDDGTIKKDK